MAGSAAVVRVANSISTAVLVLLNSTFCINFLSFDDPKERMLC